MRVRRLLLIVVLALLALVLWRVGRALLQLGVRPVIPGVLYRSSQPEGPELRRYVEELQLASVISTRGDEEAEAWFIDELAVVTEMGVDFFTVKLDGDRMPSRDRLNRLVSHLDEAPRPALVHCNWGVERAGLASAVALLLEGESVETAREQLTYRDGLTRWLTRSDLPVVLDDYEAWLGAEALEHRPQRFRRWARDHYVPYFYSAAVALTEQPAAYRAGEPAELAFRVTNTSTRPWRHLPDEERGVHIAVRLRALQGEPPWKHGQRTGYVDLEVAPGDSAEFRVTLPPFPNPGEYRLEIALVDELVAWFSAEGTQDFRTTLLVEPAAEVGGGS